MKIFMLCNVKVPLISEAEGTKPCDFGGWLDNISRFLSKDNDLTICYMNNTNTRIAIDNNLYVGFVESQAKETLFNVISEKEYDIFHVWGTEYEHSLICVNILEKKSLLDRCIVSIQGLVSVYANHYGEGIPNEYFSRKTIKELIYGNQIINEINSFKIRGIGEIELLKKVKHVIGRTNWDRACLYNINPNAKYHKCNENLRDCFYDESNYWDISNSNNHSIFVSQCSYPVKGLHYLINAMPLLLKKYPDAKIVTTGENIFNRLSRKNISLDSYKRYLIDLIDALGLREKIIFKGQLTAEQMKEEYLSANVFVCSSTIENSPNSVGEAMILGCPVVASYVGGVMDMLENNVEGYLYQTSSAEMLAYYICNVFEDEDKTVQISDNARARAHKTHNRDINNKNMLLIYNEVCNSHY